MTSAAPFGRPDATRIGIAAMLVVLTAALLPAALAEARVNREFWGVFVRRSLTTKDLNRMHDGRVGTARWVLFWSHIQPTEGGAYQWGESDSIIGALASKGIRVLPTLYGSPGYAASSGNAPPLGSKQARQEWKQFLRAAVKRYGPGGEYWSNPLLYHAHYLNAASRPIKAWQIWNEPNLPNYFRAHNRVRAYGRLVKLSHRAIRSEDSHAKVVLAGMPGYSTFHSWTFLKRLYRIRGIKRAFEVAASHPYAPNLHFVRAQLNKFRRVMVRHHDRHTPIWITEVGWGSNPSTGRYSLNKGLRGQKRMLKRSFRLFLHNRRRWGIKRVQWFEWRDTPASGPTCTFCTSAGLFKQNRDPKPSWRAFKHFTGGA